MRNLPLAEVRKFVTTNNVHIINIITIWNVLYWVLNFSWAVQYNKYNIGAHIRHNASWSEKCEKKTAFIYRISQKIDAKKRSNNNIILWSNISFSETRYENDISTMLEEIVFQEEKKCTYLQNTTRNTVHIEYRSFRKNVSVNDCWSYNISLPIRAYYYN